MKTIVLLLLMLPLSISNEPITEDCKCKEIPLYGRVRIVTAFEDFRVRIVTGLEDIAIDSTTIGPSQCGEWEFVDAFEDFTIRYVDAFEDFTIRFSDFPGLP